MKKYKEVFFYFLKLGMFGFGGPLALISSIQNDLVEKKRWMEPKEFNAVFALIKVMPGPLAFQVAVFLGRERAQFLGGLLAGLGLILPSFSLMIIFSYFFKSIHYYSSASFFLIGMQVMALGVILGSLKGLVKNNEKNFRFWFLVVLSGAFSFYYPAYEPLIILGFGLLMIWFKKSKNLFLSFAPSFFLFDQTLIHLAQVCFKAGAFVFGTGLAIVPMLSYDVVTKYHWLTQREFLEALALGQMTPGPVIITATYIGHKVAGINGALVATIFIFGPAFFHMSTWFPKVISSLKGKKWIDDFIFGAVAAVVGPIIATVFKMGALLDLNFFLYALIFLAFVLTFLQKLPLWCLIPLGGFLNLFYSYGMGG